MTVLKSLASAFFCLALAGQVAAQDRGDQSAPAVIGKKVFGVALGLPVSLPPCPVKASGSAANAFDFTSWNQSRKTCYWSPELGAAMPAERGYVQVMYAYDERPRLPDIPVNELAIFALTINGGKATAFDIITNGVSAQDATASLTKVLGVPSKEAVVPQGQSSSSNRVSWSTPELYVTYIAQADGSGRASLLFTDKDSSGLPLVNSNSSANHAVEEAVEAANAAARARAQH